MVTVIIIIIIIVIIVIIYLLCSLNTSSRCSNKAYEQDKKAQPALTFVPKNT